MTRRYHILFLIYYFLLQIFGSFYRLYPDWIDVKLTSFIILTRLFMVEFQPFFYFNWQKNRLLSIFKQLRKALPGEKGVV